MLDDPHNGEEIEVYFYHSDFCASRAQSQACLSYAETKQSVQSKHLGSASWKKERFGKPFASERAEEARSGILHITTTYVQHLQYLPFGEPFVKGTAKDGAATHKASLRAPQELVPSGYKERFTFTGKERDEETGFSYFGARYYDSDLSGLFLSVDPMADKYPSLSPYAYCAWNPVKLVDPNGDSVVLSPGAMEMHNRFYKVNDEYTKLYDDLHSCEDKLFLIGGYNERPDVHSNREGGAIVDYYPEEGSKYDCFVGDIYSVQWGDAQPELGGDESHVFLEEMFHAGQILEYGDNEGTIEREYNAKKFAIRVSTSPIDYTCEDRNGYSGVSTQLGVISREPKEDACKFLKQGRSGVTVYRWGKPIHNAVIPGAYANFPDK